MARNRTAAVANQVAYDLGYNGVRMSKEVLDGHVQSGDDLEWCKRRSVLLDRIRNADMYHWMLILSGAAVFVMALIVDYQIVHEYWTRLLSDEFGEVSSSMAASVTAKSFQVLFATLAIHFLISPRNGEMASRIRQVYAIVIFAIAFAMLAGIGIVWANAAMPENTRVFAGEATESAIALQKFTQSMGAEAVGGQQLSAMKPAIEQESVTWIRNHEVTIRLISLGVVFIVVASIGAMALDTAIRAAAARFGGAVFDNYEEAALGRRLNAEYASWAAEDPSLSRSWFVRSNRREKKPPQKPERSSADLRDEFIKSYTAGIIDRQLDSMWSSKLLVTSAGSQKLLSSLNGSVTGESGKDAVDVNREENTIPEHPDVENKITQLRR